LTGLEKDLYDRLTEKAGTLQHSVARNIATHAFHSAAGLFPLVGAINGNFQNASEDILKKRLEKSFSIDEVKNIVAEQQKQINEKLIAIRNVMLEEKTEKDTEISNLQKQLQEANNKGNQYLENEKE